MMSLAEGNFQYAWSSWSPGGALLGLLIVVVITLAVRKML
jgi:hypothetical protein